MDLPLSAPSWMSMVPLMSKALIRAALGACTPLLRTAWRRDATQPATSGVDMLVPDINSQSSSMHIPYSTRRSLRLSRSRDAVERIAVPGAITSGLIRPSFVGPRLLNTATSEGSMGFAIHGANFLPLLGLADTVAPTVMQFLAAEDAQICCFPAFAASA